MEDLDLQAMFEGEFRREPPAPLIDPTVLAGRSALRRRRILTSTAAACVLGAAAFGLTRLGGVPPAGPTPTDRHKNETPGQVERRLTNAARVDGSWRTACGRTGQPTCTAYAADAAPVSISSAGKLVRTSGQVIIAIRADDLTPPSGSLRIEVEVRNPTSARSRWWVLTRDASGTVTAQTADPEASTIQFDAWANGINKGSQAAGSPPITPARVLLGK